MCVFSSNISFFNTPYILLILSLLLTGCFPQEEILCNTEELKGELQRLQMKYDQVVEHKTLIQEEREDVSLVMKNAMKTADVIWYLVYTGPQKALQPHLKIDIITKHQF